MMSTPRPLAGQSHPRHRRNRRHRRAIVERLAGEGARVVIHYGRDQAARRGLLDRHRRREAGPSRPISPTRPAPPQLWDAGRCAGGTRPRPRQQRRHPDGDLGRRRPRRLARRLATGVPGELFRRGRPLPRRDPTLPGHGGGRIVNMASRAGQRGYAADAMPYGAAKAALINLTKSHRAQLRRARASPPSRIAPGWVRTEMAEDFVARFGEAAAVGDIPIGAMAAPDEIARAGRLRASAVAAPRSTARCST